MTSIACSCRKVVLTLIAHVCTSRLNKRLLHSPSGKKGVYLEVGLVCNWFSRDAAREYDINDPQCTVPIKRIASFYLNTLKILVLIAKDSCSYHGVRKCGLLGFS